MLTLLTLLTASSFAADCDLRALQQELADASPVAVPRVYVQIAECDEGAGLRLAGEALGRTLSGDAGNAAAEAAIQVGAGEQVRAWVGGLEPDERSRTIKHLGSRCKDSEVVADFLVDTHTALGAEFWDQRWHRGLSDCRVQPIQDLLTQAMDGPEAGAGAEDRHRFHGLLEVYSRNLGVNAIPRLTQLATSLEDTDDVLAVISAFADAANVGSLDGMDSEVAAQAVVALEGIGPELTGREVDQARTTLRALGAADVADRFSRYRWPERYVDGQYAYAVVAVEDFTCRNGKAGAVFHHALFTESGSRWPEQIREALPGALAAWELDGAERCRGTGEVRVESPLEPFANAAAAEAWLQEQRREFTRETRDYQKTSEVEHEPFAL